MGNASKNFCCHIKILVEMENFDYLETVRNRAIQANVGPLGTIAPGCNTAENIFQISTTILNFCGNWKCWLSQKTVRDRLILSKFQILWELLTMDIMSYFLFFQISDTILNFGQNQKCCLFRKQLEIEQVLSNLDPMVAFHPAYNASKKLFIF